MAAALVAVLGGAAVDLPGAAEEDFRRLEGLVDRAVRDDPVATLHRIGGTDIGLLA
ncbi:MAG: hypothetical protein GWO22_29610, partial [Actinobacteria bacterium]|nr:hypothetical protein [Actinomycetota bacterium]NIT97715.1 hypothetical protein [Actinomycetota bacterium]NIX52694.1 hypothetical protein [Actinomycetota bacterium]